MATSQYYYLEITRGIEQGKRLLLAEGAVSIGRSSENTISMHSAEKSVSSHHAIIYKSGERLMLQDLQSTNGTFINEIRVSEQALMAGDTIGLGKMGPRLALKASEDAPDCTPPGLTVSPLSTSMRTVEDDQALLVKAKKESTVNEFKSAMPALGSKDSAAFRMPVKKDTAADPAEASQTVRLEKKLKQRQINAGEMQHLLKNEERLHKIIDRGNLSRTQVSLLSTMEKASRNTRRQWIVVLSCVVCVCAAVILFFAVRYFQYKNILTQGFTLAQRLDGYERRIALFNKDPDANRPQLDSLVRTLEAANAQLAAVKSQLHGNDYDKFYNDPLERTIDGILRRFGETEYHIPPEMVTRVKYHIGVYTGSQHAVIAKYIDRKAKYFPMITETFKAKNLPEELGYISMLESGFNTHALSSAGARGLWQFMQPTGRRFGLTINAELDERLDPHKATLAAAEYFKDLIGIFGGKSSVMLAMAAYNAGEGRIMGALRKIDNPLRNRDFWYIYRMGYLAEETNEYIPRVIALMIISQEPAKYGFTPAAAPAAGEAESETDFIPLDKQAGQ
ncbi:MAG: transglycosylase SLT domain-containing protein [Chitinivibrionales bacterium]|nr:transglycosylase SLT domain-containing protein [Chitinivibrionales bacterium]